MVVGGGVAADKLLTPRQLAARWGLGLCCLVVEVALAVLIISACSRHFIDEFFLWHPILMSIGALLCLSHGIPLLHANAHALATPHTHTHPAHREKERHTELA